MFNTAQFALLTHNMGKTPYWKPEQILRLQQERLRKLVTFASKHSPFYRSRLQGMDLDRVSLGQLPAIRKDEVREHFDSIVTDSSLKQSNLQAFVSDESNLGTWYQGKYCVSHTSGSQGSPLLIVQNRECITKLFAVMGARTSTVRRPGMLEGLRRLVSPKRVAVVTFRRGFYPSSASLDFMQQIVGRFVQVDRFSSMQPDLLDRLNETQPNVIVSYAGVLENLALQRDRLFLERLEHISNSSEQLTLRARNRIEAAFEVPVLDHYGTGECLQLADACISGHVHINSDWAIVEVVDEQNRAVPAGTLGAKILVTNLANFTQPFIRYEVDDRVAISPRQDCPCGSHMPYFERIEGRASELIWVQAGDQVQFYSGVLFHSAMDSIQHIREWQVVQKASDHLHLLIQFIDGADGPSQHENANQLRERHYEMGVHATTKLTVEIVSKISADMRTGKTRRIIPLDWQDAALGRKLAPANKVCPLL